MSKPTMSYENMLGRAVDGLTIIENVSGDVEVISHSYMIAVPEADIEDYSNTQAENLQDDGWVYHEDFGWVLAVLA